MRPPRTVPLALAALLVPAACSVEDSPTEVDPAPSMSNTESSAYPAGHDFVFVYGGSWGVGTLFPSNGNGTFGEKRHIWVSNLPAGGVDVVDTDGDGDNDFLACYGKSLASPPPGGAVRLFTNDGTGSFSGSVVATAVTESACTSLREGDFNEDGLADFVVGDTYARSMFVHLQTAEGSFEKVLPGLDVADWNNTNNNAIYGVAVGDVDGDRRQDILVLGYAADGEGQVRFYKGDGTGAMASSSLLFNVKTDFGVALPRALALFDLEGDGDLDIVVGGGYYGSAPGWLGTHFIYTNDGAGNYTAPSWFAFRVASVTGVDAYDFDGDGDHDLVVAAQFTSSLYYVENLGGVLASPAFVGEFRGTRTGIGAPHLVENKPPAANAGEDQTLVRTAPEGVWVTLDGSGSYDPDGTIVLYEWFVDDELIATGVSPSVLLPLIDKDITLVVTDDYGDTSQDAVRVTVENAPPTADAGPDQTVLITFPVTFVASASDVDGWIVSYRWDMGDGTIIENDIATHVYTVANAIGYDVVLTVTDNDGDEGVSRTVKAFVLTPDEAVEDMIEVINRLEDTEGLTTNDANLLRGRLNEVLGFLAKDAYTQAEDKLHSFIRGVETRASIGRLDEAVAAQLIQDAEDVISVIGA